MKKNLFNYGVRVAIIYWIVSFVWIFTSDEIVELFVKDVSRITYFQTIKGLFFISLSSVLIYFLIRYYQKQQKTIENKIIENEERLRLFVENSRDAILVTAPDGRILDVNPSAERIFGKSASEIIEQGRKGIMDLSDPRLAEALKFREEHGYFVGELNFVHKDGTVFPGDVSTQLFTDSDGQVRTSMIIRDLRERKKLEKDLANTHFQLKRTLESISDALITVDRDWKITSINPRAAEINQKPPEEFLENDFWEEWPALIGSPFEKLVRKTMEEDTAEQTELHYYVENEYDVWLEVNMYPSEDGLTLIYRDITERKLAEQEKALYSHIIEETLNEVFVFDTKTYKFLQANKAAITNLGYTLEELKEMTPVDLKPEISQERFEELVAPLLEGTQKQVVVETVHQRKDGSTYDVEVHLQLQEMGHETLFTAIILDISRRKSNEKIIEEERQRLASIIEGTNVGTWEWNVQTGDLIVNDRWAEIVGYSLKELKPITFETWKNLTHPEDLLSAEEKLQEHFSGKSDFYNIEFRMKHKDGHWVWIQDRGKLNTWTNDGKPLMMRGTHHDISARKANEEKSLQQLEELRRWHNITLGREDRIINLKKEVNSLLEESGKPPKYESSIN